jgi:DNA-binding transcriptional MerR regulator
MAEYTIDQLAQAAGTPTSTIRMYQGRKLLEPPKRKGRVGFYDDGHLDRLRMIERLQANGFSLAAIGGLLNARAQGETLELLLGIGSVSNKTGAIRLSLDELAEQFPDQELTQSSITLALSLGLMRFEDDSVVLDQPDFLDAGAKLSAMGISLDAIIEEYEALYALTQKIALRFAQLFKEQLWDVAAADGDLTTSLPRLLEALGSLGPVAQFMVGSTFKRSLNEAASAFVNAHRREIAAAGIDLDNVNLSAGPENEV